MDLDGGGNESGDYLWMSPVFEATNLEYEEEDVGVQCYAQYKISYSCVD